MMADEIHDKENVMIKVILSMLVGIATLLVGSIGSVATADDHKYLYVFSGMNHQGRHNILALSVSGDQAELDIEVTNRGGVDVGSVDSVTILAGYMKRLLLPAELTGNGIGDRFRTVRITSTEKLWIMVRRFNDNGAIIVPVSEQVIPCSDTTHPCEKGSDDGPKN